MGRAIRYNPFCSYPHKKRIFAPIPRIFIFATYRKHGNSIHPLISYLQVYRALDSAPMSFLPGCLDKYLRNKPGEFISCIFLRGKTMGRFLIFNTKLTCCAFSKKLKKIVHLTKESYI
ncbi:hypothetical protein EZS27_043058 [termite gut metagenome]|uniref:Uncharacterized protein n=1 Tax=termite gut metagenome TaxID=433724 RepID=A0A5J4P891_9ZZZZ